MNIYQSNFIYYELNEIYETLKLINNKVISKELSLEEFYGVYTNLGVNNLDQNVKSIGEKLYINIQGIWGLKDFITKIYLYLKHQKLVISRILNSDLNYLKKKYYLWLFCFLIINADDELLNNYNNKLKEELVTDNIYNSNNLYNNDLINYILYSNHEEVILKINNFLNYKITLDNLEYINEYVNSLYKEYSTIFDSIFLKKIINYLCNQLKIDLLFNNLFQFISDDYNLTINQKIIIVTNIIYKLLDIIKNKIEYDNDKNLDLSILVNKYLYLIIDNKIDDNSYIIIVKTLKLINDFYNCNLYYFLNEDFFSIITCNNFYNRDITNINLKFLYSFNNNINVILDNNSKICEYIKQFIKNILEKNDITNKKDAIIVLKYCPSIIKSFNIIEFENFLINELNNNKQNLEYIISIYDLIFVLLDEIQNYIFDNLISYLFTNINVNNIEEYTICVEIFIKIFNKDKINKIYSLDDKKIIKLKELLSNSNMKEISYKLIYLIKIILEKSILLYEKFNKYFIFDEIRKKIYLNKRQNHINTLFFNNLNVDYDLKESILSLEIIYNILEENYNNNINFPKFILDDIFIDSIDRAIFDYINEKDTINFKHKINNIDYYYSTSLDYYNLLQNILQFIKEYILENIKNDLLLRLINIIKLQNSLSNCITETQAKEYQININNPDLNIITNLVIMLEKENSFVISLKNENNIYYQRIIEIIEDNIITKNFTLFYYNTNNESTKILNDNDLKKCISEVIYRNTFHLTAEIFIEEVAINCNEIIIKCEVCNEEFKYDEEIGINICDNCLLSNIN